MDAAFSFFLCFLLSVWPAVIAFWIKARRPDLAVGWCIVRGVVATWLGVTALVAALTFLAMGHR